jgi:hypothetical protein
MASKGFNGTKVLALLVQKQKLTTSARTFKRTQRMQHSNASTASSTQTHAALKRINRMQLTTSAPHAPLNRTQHSNACS